MKGFTLIELLGVLVVLGFLALIVIPITTNLIKENKETLYNNQIKNIEEGARCLIAKNLFKINDYFVDDKLAVKLSTIKNSGCLGQSIINPKTSEEFSNDMVIQVLNDDGNYTYTVCGTNVVCDTFNTYYGE